MRTSSASPRMPLLIFLSAISILPINMFAPALSHMAEDLEVSYALMNLSVSGYALMTAVSHLAAGILSDRYGRRPVALVALTIFTLASIGCVFATRIDLFLLFRMAQGVIVAVYAVSLAAIRDTSEPAVVRSRIGALTAAWAVAPLIGPTLGGSLSSAFGWRANFLAFVLLGAVAFSLTWFRFHETHHTRSSGPLHLKRSYGILMSSRNFRAYTACMAFATSMFYIFVGTAPRVAESLGDPSTTIVGMLMGMVTAGFMLGSTLTSRIRATVEPGTLILAGRALTVGGLVVALGLLVLWAPHTLAFFIPCIFIGIGNGLTIPTANARVLAIGDANAGTALGLANAFTIVTAAVLSALSGLAADSNDPHIWVILTLLTVALLGLFAATIIVRMESTAPTTTN